MAWPLDVPRIAFRKGRVADCDRMSRPDERTMALPHLTWIMGQPLKSLIRDAPGDRRAGFAQGGRSSSMNHVVGLARQGSVALPRVEVASRSQVEGCRHWATTLGAQAKDRRYYELVEDTIHAEFDYRYFIVRDETGEISAIQPFFLLDQDLLVGAKARFGRLIAFIRRLWPRFMIARTLMMGCAAGEGHLDGSDQRAQRSSMRLLASTLVKEARRLGARLVVLKEFPAKYRSILDCFVEEDFTRIPSMPNVMLNIDYPDFEGYMKGALSGNARRNLRRKLKAADQAAPIEMSIVEDITPLIDEVYPLYLDVYNRSHLHFEKLTREYFCGLARLGDKSRVFIWRQNGRLVAFGSCLLQGDMIHGEYLGLDYTVALDMHLYHSTFRDLISWAIANGYKRFHSSALNYDPKFHLRYRLDPIDLYVRHTSTFLNAILRHILPCIEPTRFDKTLPLFDNYDELWAPAAGRRKTGLLATARAAVSQATRAVVSSFAELRSGILSALGSLSTSLETNWGRHVASACAVAVSTLVLLGVSHYVDSPYLIFAYALLIPVVAARFGRAAALSAAVLSSICAAFFLIEPGFSFGIETDTDFTAWLSFCVTALLISQLPGRRYARNEVR